MSQASSPSSGSSQGAAKPAGSPSRESDALYQKGKVVARIVEPEINPDGKEFRFGEISNSDELMIPEECEFREFRILIQKIAYATKIQRGEEHKGRVLRGVVADLLGWREQ